MIFELPSGANIVPAFVPQDLSSAANTGDWVSMANYRHCTCVFIAEEGTAGDDPQITLQQATSAAGAGAKALNFNRSYEKLGATAITAVGTWTLYDNLSTTDATGAVSGRVSNAENTLTNLTWAENEKVVAIPIDINDLDVANDFLFIQMSVADVGTNAGQFGVGFYILSHSRYQQDSPSVPSAIA